MCTWLSLLDLGNNDLFVDPVYVWGLNFSIRKKTLFELGGFHPDCIPSTLQQYQGDGETGLSYKANMLGYKAYYSPSIMLYHQISKERLTIDYFEKRAFYQGVCDSFTKIRIRNKLYTGLDDLEKNDSVSKSSYFKNIVQRIKSKLKPDNSNPEPANIQELRQQLYLKHLAGYNFHQQAYQTDQTVRNWVLKEDYWDYKFRID
jgi:hypothetical protein